MGKEGEGSKEERQGEVGGGIGEKGRREEKGLRRRGGGRGS